MIIGPDFVWLHFPKCGGVAVQSALRKIYEGRSDIAFDDIRDYSNIIWHQNIVAREAYDPSFERGDRKIVCCIRRLPHWLLSRVHFEAERAPDHYTATRDMFLRGEFFERNGKTNNADTYVRVYSTPAVTHWVRLEHLGDDLADALEIPADQLIASLKRENATKANYIKNLDFWFTAEDLVGLYEANPVWAAIEKRVYGEILTL